jgi:tetratricopeptide (TPR) repeat protein
VTDNLFNSLTEIIDNFFDQKQANEFTSLYVSSISEEVPDQSIDKNNHPEFKIQDGLSFRSQIDLLITFSANRLPKEKYLSMLLYLSQSSITNGEFATAIEINERIIALTSNDSNMTDITSNAYLLVGEIYSRQANWENSFNYIRKAHTMFDSVNNLKGVAKCENLLGTIYGDLGDVKTAIENFESALSKTLNEPDYALKGKIEINLGIVNNIKGKTDEALGYFKRALLNYEKISDNRRIAEIHQNIGMVYTKKTEYDSAIKKFDESLALAIESNYLQTIGVIYLSKAFVHSQLSDYSLSTAFADKAMEVAYKLNDKLTIAEVYKIKGVIQKNLKNYLLSENYLLTSLRLNIDAGNQLNQAETHHELGLLYKKMNDSKKSKENFNSALEYFKKINAEPEIRNLESLITLKK